MDISWLTKWVALSRLGGAAWLMMFVIGCAGLPAADDYEAEDDVEDGVLLETAKQAVEVVPDTLLLSPAASAQIALEGGNSFFTITSLCVDDPSADVFLDVDWGDGNSEPTMTLSPPGTGWPTTAGCGANYEVCGTPACDLFPDHVYSDGGDESIPDPDRTYTITVTALQDGGVTPEVETIDRVVTNVGPTFDSYTVTPSTDRNEGESITFEAFITDPGQLGTEIETVEWVFTGGSAPDGSIAGQVYHILCDCTAAAGLQCEDQDSPGDYVADDQFCGQSTVSPLDQRSSQRTIQLIDDDDGPYQVSVTVTDEMGLTATLDQAFTVDNLDPTINTLTVDGGAYSNDDLAALGDVITVDEGALYEFASTISDDGIDNILVSWDYGDTNTYTGDVTVTETSRPAPDVATFSVPDILAPIDRHRWDEPVAPSWTMTYDLDDQNTGTDSRTITVNVTDIAPVISGWDAATATIFEGNTPATTLGFDVLSSAPLFDGMTSVTWWAQLNVGGVPFGMPVAIDDTVAPITFDDGSDNGVTIEIDSLGCSGTIAVDTASPTCNILFLDGDGPATALDIWPEVFDEDNSSTPILPKRINVTNVAPTISAENILNPLPDEASSTDVEFDFADPAGAWDGGATPYLVEIDWDGNDVIDETPAATPAAPGSLSFSHTYPQNGPNQVKVTICEEAASTATAECVTLHVIGSINVQNVAPTASIDGIDDFAGAPVAAATPLVEGMPYTLNGSWTDPGVANDNDYDWMWTWDEDSVGGSAGYGTPIANAAILFADIPDTTLSLVSRDIDLDVTDGEDPAATVTTGKDVRDNVPQISIVDVELDQPDELAIPTIVVTMAAETAADELTDFSVDWGSGETEAEFFAMSDGAVDYTDLGAVEPARLLDGTPNPLAHTVSLRFTRGTGSSIWSTGAPMAYENSSDSMPGGQFVVTALVWDEDSFTEDSTGVTVLNVAPTIDSVFPLPPGPLVVNEGQGASLVVTASDVSAIDAAGMIFHFNWNDVLDPGAKTVDGDYDPATPLDSVGRGTYFYPGPGNYTVNICAEDPDGTVADNCYDGGLDVDVEVNNLAPVIDDTFNTGPIVEGDDVTAVTMVDNRGAETLTYRWRTDCPFDNETDLRLAVEAEMAVFPFDTNEVPFDTGDVLTSPAVASVIEGINYTDSGFHNICVAVCDDDDIADSCVYDVTVVDVLNSVPIINSFVNTSPIIVAENAAPAVSFTYAVSDAGGDVATVAADCGTGAGFSPVASPFSCGYTASGTYSVTLLVTDDDGASSNSTIIVTVTNVAPTVDTFTYNVGVPDEDTSAVFSVTATDLASDQPLSFRYDLDGDGAFDIINSSGDGTSSASFLYPTSGSYSATVTVCDVEGACSGAAPLAVSVGNTDPAIISVSMPSVLDEDQNFTITVDATDDGGDALLYTFDFAGEIPAIGPAPASTYTASFPDASAGFTVTVTVDDGQGGVVSTGVPVVVNNVIPSIIGFQGAPLSFAELTAPGQDVVFSYGIGDTSSDVAGMVEVQDCGGGTLTAGAGTFSCNYTNSGVYTASLTIRDDDGAEDTTVQTVTVLNAAPTAVSLAVTNTPDEATAATLQAMATDFAADHPLSFRYDFDGDGAFDQIVSETDGSGTATSNVSYLYPSSGDYSPTVTVCDAEGACASPVGLALPPVTVVNGAPSIVNVTAASNVGEGVDFSIAVEATDPGGDALLYSFAFAEVPANNSIDQAASSYTTSFTTSETVNITVTVKDDDGATDTWTGAVVVTNAAPVITSFNSPDALVFDEALTPGTDVTFNYAIEETGTDTTIDTPNCGGGTLTDTVANDGTFECNYEDSGNYNVQLTVEDTDGESVSRTLTVTVRNVAPVISAFTLDNAPTETLAADFTVTATDLASDEPLTYRFDVENDGVVDVVTNDATTSYTYATSGSYTAKVTVCDVEGFCSNTTVPVVVDNVAPSIVNVTGASNVAEGQDYTLLVEATDPGNDTLLYSFEFAEASANDSLLQPASSYTSSFNATGTINITVTVTDSDGDTDTWTGTVDVTNAAPIITSFTSTDALTFDEAVAPGTDVAFTYAAQDSGTDTTTDTPTCGDGILTDTVPNDGAFECNFEDSGTYNVQITVEDDDGESVSRSLTVTVRNVAPTITDFALDNAPTEDTPAQFTVTATDLTSDEPLSYRFDVDNDGIFDVLTTSNTLEHLYDADGLHSIQAMVCDVEGACATDTIVDFSVGNADPVITGVMVTPSASEGADVTVSVAASDAGMDMLEYEFVFTNTTGPGGTTIAYQTSEEVTVQFDNPGSYTVDVTVRDAGDVTSVSTPDQGVFMVVNDDPVIAMFDADLTLFDESLTGQDVNFTYTVTDTGDDMADIVVEADCDDGAGFAAVTGAFVCSYTDAGSYTVTLRTTDDDTAMTTSTIMLTAQNAAPTIGTFTMVNAVGDEPSEVNDADFEVTISDVGVDGPFSISWDFDGDNLEDAVTSIATIGDTGAVSFGYPTSGAYTARVTVCDVNGDCATSMDLAVDVENSAPAISGVNVPAVVSSNTGVTVIAHASDPGNDALEYMFEFKDSASAVVKSVPWQASNVITESFSVSDAYSVEVSVRDVDVDQLVDPLAPWIESFTVTDVNSPVTGSANPAQLLEGGTTKLTAVPAGGAAPFSVSFDVNGDGTFDILFDTDADTIPDADSKPCDPNDDLGGGVIPCDADVTFIDNQEADVPYRVFVSVTDAGGVISTGFLTVAVDNEAPAFDAPPADMAVTETNPDDDTMQIIPIRATDVGTLDDLTFELIEGPDGMTLENVVNTMDPAEVAPSEIDAELHWEATWEYIGFHDVTVAVTDKDGAVTEHTFQIEVEIYDVGNSNGVSDYRETIEFGGPITETRDVDTDGDGINDLSEMLAGTDPTVADWATAPLVIFPDDENVDTLTPFLKVANASSPRDYELTYNFTLEDLDGNEIWSITGVAEGESVTEVEVPASAGLAEDTDYNWYASASEEVPGDPEVVGDPAFRTIEGEVSETATFLVSVTNEAPPAPDALTPLDGATFVLGATPLLEAVAVTDADGDMLSYWFEIADIDDFSNIIITSDARPIPYYGLGDILLEGTYYWRCFVSDGVNADVVGSSASFLIQRELLNLAPSMPEIVSPNAETLTETSATLTINASTDPEGDPITYQFERADNAAFADAEASGDQAELTYEVTELGEMDYYWRVRASDGVAVSEWAIATFTVNAENQPPAGLSVITPADGSLLQEAPTVFKVNNAIDEDEDELTYTFELAIDEEFAEVIDSGDVEEGDELTEWMPAEETILEEGMPYYWRVTVTDGTDSTDVTAAFTIYEVPKLSDDGCGCTTTGAKRGNSFSWLAFALLGLVAVIRRRRR